MNDLEEKSGKENILTPYKYNIYIRVHVHI